MTYFRGHRMAILEAAGTGSCRPWFAKDLVADGVATWTLGTHNPEAVTLTAHGRHLATVLRGIDQILSPPPDDWSLDRQETLW